MSESELGEILTDGEGRTLYLFTVDGQGQSSSCYDQCAQTWPALIGDVNAGEGLNPTLLGAAPRTDGSQQVTYNGWPLYYFAPDVSPGDTKGQGVGDVWWVIDANGEPVQ